MNLVVMVIPAVIIMFIAYALFKITRAYIAYKVLCAAIDKYDIRFSKACLPDYDSVMEDTKKWRKKHWFVQWDEEYIIWLLAQENI